MFQDQLVSTYYVVCEANAILNLIIIAVGIILSYQIMNLSKHLNGKDTTKK